MALGPTTYNVYNMVLNAPSITVIAFDTVYLSNFKGQLATAQVQQAYNGCTLATSGDIVGYQRKDTDMQYKANGFVYDMINDNQIKFWWKPTEVTVIPPS